MKTVSIYIRTTEEIKTILEQQAERNRRSMAGQIEYLILQEESKQNKFRRSVKMTNVVNSSGAEIGFESALNYMDQEIADQLNAELAPCSEQAFFTAYEKAHAEKYGEWELSKANPTW